MWGRLPLVLALVGLVAACSSAMPTSSPTVTAIVSAIWTPSPTFTLTPASTMTPTGMPTSTPAYTPTFTPSLTPTPLPKAVVVVDVLNLRAGPGTAYDIVGKVQQGDELKVMGQAYECRWLKVSTPEGSEGWVSGKAEYVSLNLDCTEISSASLPPTPMPRPTPTAISDPDGDGFTTEEELYFGTDPLVAEPWFEDLDFVLKVIDDGSPDRHEEFKRFQKYLKKGWNLHKLAYISSYPEPGEKHPWDLLADGGGNCSAWAIFDQYVLSKLGYESYILTVRYQLPDRETGHARCVSKFPDGWYLLDFSGKRGPVMEGPFESIDEAAQLKNFIGPGTVGVGEPYRLYVWDPEEFRKLVYISDIEIW